MQISKIINHRHHYYKFINSFISSFLDQAAEDSVQLMTYMTDLYLKIHNDAVRLPTIG